MSLRPRERRASSAWASGRPANSCGAAGAVLEGTVDLAVAFGALPSTVYLAVAPYASPDGGALYPSAQMPATTDSDGDIDASEIAAVTP